MSKILEAALYYARHDLGVIPLKPGLKRPATKNGLLEGTTDPDQIKRWFEKDGKNKNIGIVTGSGFLAIDIDVKGGVDGYAELQELEKQYGELPVTTGQKTASGGKHLFFRYPETHVIKSSVRKLGAGIDIRAEGGYVVAPPSVLDASKDPEGKIVSGRYEWLNTQIGFAALPPVWLEFLAYKPKGSHSPNNSRSLSTPNDPDLAEVQDALSSISPDLNYDDWIKIGAALYHSLGEQGFSVWDAWSQHGAKYQAAEMRGKWASFQNNPNPAKLSSLFYLAQQNGWQNPAKGRKPSPALPTIPAKNLGYEHREEWRGHSVPTHEQDHVRLVSGLSITPRQMEWVWQQWLPKGKLSLLVGAPKTGKTLLAIDLAATITSGGTFPDGTRADKSTVIFWTAEDDLDDTIVPRFKAAGGDLANVRFIDHTVSGGRGQPFNPAQDMPLLMDAIQRMDKPPALLIIDPVVSVTQDMNNALQVRMSLLPVVEMAQQHGMAVLGITHFRKSSGESGNIGERIIGSSAFLQVARMVWYAMKPPDMDSTRLFFKGDTNLAESDEGFLYEVESREAEFPEHLLTVQTAGIVWGEKIEGEALQALIKPDAKIDSAPVQVEAEEFLKSFLASGARLKTDLEAEADNRGITKIALTRAKKSLGIQHRKRVGDGRFIWYLPSEHVDQAHTHDKHDPVDQHDKHVELEEVIL